VKTKIAFFSPCTLSRIAAFHLLGNSNTTCLTILNAERDAFLSNACRRPFDVAVMEINGNNSIDTTLAEIEAIRELLSLFPGKKLIAYSANHGLIQSCLDICGIFIPVIDKKAALEMLPLYVTEKVRKRARRPPLTIGAAQEAVMHHCLDGEAFSTIGNHLGIQVKTVSSHKGQILNKVRYQYKPSGSMSHPLVMLYIFTSMLSVLSPEG
jgi:DNA-binding NarL/FixJ family response regulator